MYISLYTIQNHKKTLTISKTLIYTDFYVTIINHIKVKTGTRHFFSVYVFLFLFFCLSINFVSGLGLSGRFIKKISSTNNFNRLPFMFSSHNVEIFHQLSKTEMYST